MEQLGAAFAAYDPLKHSQIGPYRIDKYLLKPKIAIKCDEHEHKPYDGLREMQRQPFIGPQLCCTCVRFDPYTLGFCLKGPVGEVVQKLTGEPNGSYWQNCQIC